MVEFYLACFTTGISHHIMADMEHSWHSDGSTKDIGIFTERSACSGWRPDRATETVETT